MRWTPRSRVTSARLARRVSWIVRLAVAATIVAAVTGCRTLSGPPTLTTIGRTIDTRTSYVVVDQREPSFITFSGIAAEAGEAALDQASSVAAGQTGIAIVGWTEFLEGLDGYAASVVVRNDYPNVRVADGLACLVARQPGSPWGLTWNGGIALTALDYEHVRSTYGSYQAGARARPPDDPGADPVHPGGFLPALGCLWLWEVGGPSPLHRAAERGDVLAMEELLAQGADVHARGGRFERTPLHLVTTGPAAELLLDHGADMLAADRDGRTPLHLAAALGRTAVVDVLLEHGMDPSQFDFPASWCVCPGGTTPLYEAAVFGQADTARLLLDRGAAVDLGDTTYVNTPALQIAAWHGHIDVVTLLLDRGADVNYQDRSGTTALHEAAEHGHTDVVTLLLDRGADPNLEVVWGETPLFGALFYGKLDTAAVLIRYGADVNHRDRRSSTPLHTGVLDFPWNDPEKAAQLLLDAGADPSLEDERGNTPVDIAVASDLPAVAEMLRRRLTEKQP